MSQSNSSIVGWVAGIIAAVISGVGVYHLTEGREIQPPDPDPPSTPDPPTPISSAPSSQPNIMGLLCIGNATNQTVFFQYRWGEGPWLNGRVDVGNWAVLRWSYAFPNQNISPNLEVLFDTNLTQLVEYQNYLIPPQDITSVPLADCTQIPERAYSFAINDMNYLSLQSP